MDFRQLEALVAVVDHGSFSRAGEALGSAQSNISTRIKNLEHELGAVLIDRASMSATPEGQLVFERARRILQEEEAIGTDVRSLAEIVQGTVAIGMIGTTGRWLIPHLLRHQRLELPNVSLHIVEGTNSSLEPRLATSQLDLAILSLPLSNNTFRSEELFTENLVLVAPMKGPHAVSEDLLGLDDVAKLELLLPLRGTPLRNEIDEAASQAGIELQPAIELDGIRTLASLCFDGEGVAILPASAIPAHLTSQFRAVAIRDLPPRRVALALPPYGMPSSPTWAVHRLIRDIVANDTARPDGLSTL